MKTSFFTSESVTEGHPDKLADQISDSILDSIMAGDPKGRVACETLCTTGLVVVSGEISTSTYVDIQSIVRNTVRDVGYTRAKYGFDYETCGVMSSIHEQSPDIAQGVNSALEDRKGESCDEELDKIGAGDQGMMFGYACNETPELMPIPIMIAHQLALRLAEVRKAGIVPYLRPDGKTEVTVEYENGQPKRITTIVIAAQHNPSVDIDNLMAPDLMEHVVKPIISGEMVDYKNLRFLVNPTGKFVRGGPMGDTGLTGRKIIVDTYGGAARHGGGCFSGKDPTKVDRSAAYAARYVAKNCVAAGLADRLEVQVAYAIGVAHPISIMVETFGTEKIAKENILKLIKEHFDLRPAAIIRDLKLQRPIYRKTAAYGHFGRNDKDFTWEKTDKADTLRHACL
jgi:S-adenosylmethionine synthetase